MEKRLSDGEQEQHRVETLPKTIAKQRLELGDQLEIAEQVVKMQPMRSGLPKPALQRSNHCNATLTMPLRQRVKTKSAPKPMKNAATPPLPN